jgi:hypothetical protein
MSPQTRIALIATLVFGVAVAGVAFVYWQVGQRSSNLITADKKDNRQDQSGRSSNQSADATHSRSAVRLGQNATAAAIATEYAQASDLRALFDVLVSEQHKNNATAKFYGSKILMDCAQVIGANPDIILSEINPASTQQAQRKAAFQSLKHSCRGFSDQRTMASTASTMKSEALSLAEPNSSSEQALKYLASGRSEDAYAIMRGLLDQNPVPAGVLEDAISMMLLLGRSPASNTPELQQFSPEMLNVAARLAACEAMNYCTGQNSFFLLQQCAALGQCAESYEAYLAQIAFNGRGGVESLRQAANLIRPIIESRDWNRLGLGPGNRPTQTAPSILPKG